MADPNESHRAADDTPQQPDTAISSGTPSSAGTPPASPAESADIVEAEVVDPPSTSEHPVAPQAQPAGSGSEQENFRQYQQFLEFQKFQEWQRQHGSAPDAPQPSAQYTAPQTDQSEVPWKRALRTGARGGKRALWTLRFKFVRRLLYLVLIILLFYWALHHFFGSSQQSGNGGAPADSVPITATAPKPAIRGLHNYIAHAPDQACLLFTDSGKSAFAFAHGAPDCTTAARSVNRQISNPDNYANPSFSEDAVQTASNEAVVDSCKMQANGGPPLGKFRLVRGADNGWLIDRYQAAAC